MFCTNCGKEIPDNTKICTNCGAITQIPMEHNINVETANISSEQTEQPDLYNNVTPSLTKYNKPLTTTAFFFTQILFMIPFINLFFILLWSFKKNTNENRKAYARSMLIWIIITIVFSIFVLLTMAFMKHPMNIL